MAPDRGDREERAGAKAGSLRGLVGTVYSCLPPKFEKKALNPVAVRAALCEALDADSRIAFIDPSTETVAVTGRTVFRPPKGTSFQDLLNVQEESFVRLDRPISFRVVVPSKNQPQFSGRPEPLPTEYYACWDGDLFMAFWETPSPEQRRGDAGMIVRDIITEATSRAGYSPKIQGPSPAHLELAVEVVKELHESTFSHLPNRIPVRLTISLPDWNTHALGEADDCFWNLRIVAEAFYSTENNRERAFFWEAQMDEDLKALQTHQYTLVRGKSDTSWDRLANLAARRLLRSQSRLLVGQLWLAAAELQSAKATLNESLRLYDEDSTSTIGFDAFKVDAGLIRAEAQAIDTTFVTQAIDSVSRGLDSRDLAFKTVSAAVVGAALALLVAYLVSGPHP